MTNDEIDNLTRKFNAASNLHNRFLEKICTNQDEFFNCKFWVDSDENRLAIELNNLHFEADWSIVRVNSDFAIEYIFKGVRQKDRFEVFRFYLNGGSIFLRLSENENGIGNYQSEDTIESIFRNFCSNLFSSNYFSASPEAST